MNIRMYLAFLKWSFMKIFGGCFHLAYKFRRELKKGAPDSIFAVVGFVLLSVVSLATVLITSACFIEDKPTIGVIAASGFWLAIVTFVYNVVKASFECFLAERERVFDELKR